MRNDIIRYPNEISLDTGILRNIVLTQKAEIINDLSKDSRNTRVNQTNLSKICVPIIIKENVFAIINCESPSKDFFSKQHLITLTAIASICAIKVENLKANRKLKKSNEKLQQINFGLTVLKLKTFNSFMNSHFVFNTLNSIQSLITSENKLRALRYLSFFSKLIRFCLKSLEKEKVSLVSEVEMLNWYLNLQKLRYNNRFDFSIQIDGDSTDPKAEIPSYIFQIFLENVIEQVIYNQYKNYFIKIFFRVNKKIIVADISYNYDKDSPKNKQIPEYRVGMLKWEDQVRTLNSTKNYNIKKKITYRQKGDTTYGSILLKLPNLNFYEQS